MEKNASGLNNSKREIMIARVIFAVAVILGGAFFVYTFINSGFSFWLGFFIIIWLIILWRFWFNIVKGSLTLTFMLGYFLLAIFISIIAMALAKPQGPNSTKNSPQTSFILRGY